MSKNSGIMRLDSPGKLGPGLDIDQELFRKQILAAKQASLNKVIFLLKFNGILLKK